MRVDEISLFLNPAAGRGRAKNMGAPIVAEFRDHGISVNLIESVAERDLEEKIHRAASRGARTIIVAGGDGSVHEAVNGVLNAGTDSALGIIPIGTGNDFAKAIHLSPDWHKATHAIAMKIRDNTPARKIDVGKMNGRYFANGAGIGFDAKINNIARKNRWPIGDLVYLLAVLEGLWDGVITPTVKIRSADYVYDGPVTLANISNGPWGGGMFHIAPMAEVDDGFLDLIIADPMSRARIVRLIPNLIRGSHIGKPGVRHFQVDNFTLSSTEPLPNHLDGESQPLQSEFKISLLKHALRIL